MVLIGRTTADADRADQPSVPVDGHSPGDEQQGPVKSRGQGVEDAARLHGVDQVGGGGVQLQCCVRLAGAGLAGDQYGPVVPAEGEQVAARVQDGDADGGERP